MIEKLTFSLVPLWKPRRGSGRSPKLWIAPGRSNRDLSLKLDRIRPGAHRRSWAKQKKGQGHFIVQQLWLAGQDSLSLTSMETGNWATNSPSLISKRTGYQQPWPMFEHSGCPPEIAKDIPSPWTSMNSQITPDAFGILIVPIKRRIVSKPKVQW